VTLLRIPVRAFERFLDDRGPDHAAAVSYYAILSILPLCLFLIWIGLVFQGSFESAYSGALFVLQGVVAQLDPQSKEALRGATEGASRLQWPALILLVWTSRRVFSSLFGALERVFRVPPRGFAKGNLFAMAMVLLAGVGLLLTLAFTVTFAMVEGFLREWAGEQSAGLFLGLTMAVLTIVGPPLLTYLFIFMIYRLASRGSVSVQALAGGALLAAVLWELAKAAFAYYVRNLAQYRGLYGALEGVIVLAVWLELSVTILLYCAEILAVWADRPEALSNSLPTP
jgi:membrane protein